MRLRDRLDKLEAKEPNIRPAILCFTSEGLKDLHGHLIKTDNLDGVKVIVGVEPEDL